MITSISLQTILALLPMSPHIVTYVSGLNTALYPGYACLLKYKKIEYKGCIISYQALDYGLRSSAVAHITFFNRDAFGIASISLKEATESIQKAEINIIKQAKNWINNQLAPKRNNNSL